jgi:hypothetical protein
MSERYVARRAEFEQAFARARPLTEGPDERVSPSGQFVLRVDVFENVDTGWRYSRGVVRRARDGALVADIRRNYGGFWHAWVTHDEHEYLLCGEDYQGYCVIECELGRTMIHFPEEGYEGMGFCWYHVLPSPDGRTLAIEGCRWAGSSELVFVDFAQPLVETLLELDRFAFLDRTQGWQSSTEFRFSVFKDEEEEPPSIDMTWSRSN